MSALSGLGAKGEKGKGKFTSININNIYKGTSASTQKSTVSSRQHGLQSLGKVGGSRRMPPPAHLPSLRSENSGNDPNINLVPTGSSGWGTKEEQEQAEQLQQQQQQQQPPQARTPVENQQTPVKKTPEPGGRPQPSSLQQPVIPQQSPQGQKQATAGTGGPPPTTTHGANITQGANIQQQTGGNTTAQSNNTNQAGGKSWSSVTMGGNKKAGGFLDQKSPFFQEEFPSLVSGGEEKSQQQKKEEEKEPQYGPGPSLRPQNVGNWKEGGGRGAMQQQQQLQQDQQQNGTPTSGGAAAAGEREADRDSPAQPIPPHAMIRPGQPMPMGPGGPMIPPHFRGMMPPYMFGRGGFPPGYPPNFHPGMQRPPYPPYPDQRFRGPHPGGPPHMGDGRRPEDGERTDQYKRPAIIKDQDLKEFDDLLNNDASDGGWAGAQGEIDYSEKLVFSDDEDNGNNKDRDHDRPPRDRRDHRYDDSDRRDDRRERAGRDRRDDDYRRDDRPHSRDSDKDRPEYERQRSGERGMYGGPREAWGPHPAQYGRGPMDRQWQGQIAFDQRGPPPGGFPPQFRMGPRGPVPPVPGPNQRPGPGSPLYPPTSGAAPTSPSGASGPPASSPGASPAKGDEEDDMWNKRRRQQNEEMAAAVERARQRREDEERRIELERKAAAQEKLKRLEEKLKEDRALRKSESEKEKQEGSDAEHHRSRTGSESSDKGFNKGEKYAQGQQYSRQYTKNMPPRFQKQHGQGTSESGGHSAQTPMSPQAGQSPIQHTGGQTSPGMRHGPSHWYPNDPRAWGGMPPPGYGPGRPMDMQGMPMHPPVRRGRTDSGSDSHDGERRTPEMPFDRDLRLWADRPMPYGPMPGWEEQMRRGGPVPAPYFDQRNYSGEYEHHDERYGYEEKRRSEDRESDKSLRDRDVHHHKEYRDQRESYADRPPSRDKFDEISKENKYNKEEKRERRDSKDSRDSRDSKKDRSDKEERNERERPPRPPSDEKHHVEERPKRDRDHRDRRNKEPRHSKDETNTDGWGDHPTDFHTHSYGPPQGFRAGPFRGRNEWGQQHTCPPPISAQQVQETLPPRSTYTSLKRSQSGGTAERKNDSQKESEDLVKVEEPKVDKTVKEPQKDPGGSSRDSKTTQEETIHEEKEPKGKGKEERQEGRPQKSKDHWKDDKRKRDDNRRKNDRREDRKSDRREDPRDDRRDKDRPPTKRMKDDDRSGSRRGRSSGGPGELHDDRGAKGSRGRGNSREFVGRGRSSRGRSGYSTVRGRGGRGRGDFRGFDGKSSRYSSEGRGPKPNMGSNKKEDSDHSEAEEWNEEHVESRRRTKGEDSDVSIDEASASISESSSDKINDSREGSKAREMSKESGDLMGSKAKNTSTPSRDVKNPWGVLPNSGKPSTERGTFPTAETKSEFREHMKKEEKRGDDRKEEKHEERKDRRDDRREDRRDDRRDRRGDRRDRRDPRDHKGDGRNRGGHQRYDRDGDQTGFAPRGEPSRRGRGSYSRGRGGRGGGSAPPKSSSSSNVWQNKMAYRTDQEQFDGHDGKENKSRKWERDYRFDRNAPPPRFSRSASGPRGGRGGGFCERGRGGGRGRGSRGNNQSASRGRTKPQLQKQNSSDMGNEEWETASESSDVLDRRDSKNELKDQSGKEKERKEAKKSFSSQRPSSDRQNRRANSAETRNSVERTSKGGSKERSPTAKMNGAGPTTGRNGNQTKANKTLANSSKKENTSAVYRMDEIVLNDPTAVQNAINKTKTSKKSSDLSDVSKPLKSEKEKKTDALANIDINNYASVVVIDDQPEVSIDDPTFLFENNEGFQEVTSKKQQKKTIKAAQEEAARQKVQEEKKEKTKKGGKGRGAASSESKRMSKLPPRLAKQKLEKEKEKQQHKDAIEVFMPKIEAWDNELANNIPPPAAIGVPEPPKVSVMSEQNTSTSPSVPYSMGMPTPAPVPAVNAWEKPISITPASVPVSNVGPNGQVKFDPKADQHDSGIDISEPQNSNSSSTRSSPSTENKLRGTDMLDIAEKMDDSTRTGDLTVLTLKPDGQFDPKPQRQPKTSREKQIEADDNSNRVVKKPDIKPEKTMENETSSVIASTKSVPGMEPIQLPASFKGFNFSKGEDSSDIKLDFTFDAELAKLTEEKSEAKEVGEQMSQPMSMPNQTSRVTALQSPTSPATEDLNLKIASVKNVWETMPIMPTVFEHSMGSVASSSAASVSVSDAEPVSTSQHFPSFSSSVENTGSVGPDLTQPVVSGPPSSQETTVSVEAVSRKQEMSATAEPFVVSSLSHGQSAGLASYMDNVVTTSSGHMKTMVSEQSNVCKVKPQLQNMVQSSAIDTNPSLPLQTMGLGSISLTPVTTPTTTPSMANIASLTGIPSPPAQQPVIIAQVSQYHPFSALGGSQLMAQETRQFSGYSTYGLSQPPQAATGTPLAAPAQTSYTQASLFLQTAPAAAAQSDLYGSTNQYRSQYGSTQQPNTIMVSSTSTSTAIKPPAAPSQFNEFITGSSLSSGKSNPLAPLQYGQLVNNAPSLQPSGMYVSFDPSQSVNTNQPPPAAAAATPTGSLSSSQLISSQLVQPQRASVQAVQPQSSFYSQQTPLQQTGFYQAQQSNPASNLGVVQQNQYPVQGFGTQPPTGLNLSLQPSAPAHLGSASTLNKAAAPFKPAAQQHQTASQLKSPPHSGATNSSGFPSVNTFQSTGSFPSSNSFAGSGFGATTTTQSPSTKLPPPFNSFAASFSQTQQQSTGNQSAQHPTPTQQQPQGILTTPNLSQPPPPVKPSMQKGSSSQQQFTTKMNQSFSAQSPIQPSGNLLQAQLMMGIRPSSAPPANQNRFQNPIQRPGMMIAPPQRQARPSLLQQGQQASFEPKKSQQSQTPSTTTVTSSSSAAFSSTANSPGAAGSAAFRAQQAKQRAELLAHAQSFLNPNKKPAPKKAGDSTEGVGKDSISSETSEEKTIGSEEKVEVN